MPISLADIDEFEKKSQPRGGLLSYRAEKQPETPQISNGPLSLADIEAFEGGQKAPMQPMEGPPSPATPISLTDLDAFEQTPKTQAQRFKGEIAKAPSAIPETPADSLFRHSKAVLTKSAESLNMGVASFMQSLADVDQYIRDKTDEQDKALVRAGGMPIPENLRAQFDPLSVIAKIIKPETIEKGMQFFLDNAETWKAENKKYKPGMIDDLVGEAIGGAVPGIGEFMLNVPWATLKGAAEAHKRGDSEVWGALKAGAERFILGKIFHAIGKLPKAAAVPATGAVFGAQTALEGKIQIERAKARGASPEEIAALEEELPEEIAKATGTGLLYGLMGGKKKAADLTPEQKGNLAREIRLRAELPDTDKRALSVEDMIDLRNSREIRKLGIGDYINRLIIEKKGRELEQEPMPIERELEQEQEPPIPIEDVLAPARPALPPPPGLGKSFQMVEPPQKTILRKPAEPEIFVRRGKEYAPARYDEATGKYLPVEETGRETPVVAPVEAKAEEGMPAGKPMATPGKGEFRFGTENLPEPTGAKALAQEELVGKAITNKPYKSPILTDIRNAKGINPETSQGEAERYTRKEKGTTGIVAAAGKGLGADKMREVLTEKGRLPEGSTVRDMWDVIDREFWQEEKGRENQELKQYQEYAEATYGEGWRDHEGFKRDEEAAKAALEAEVTGEVAAEEGASPEEVKALSQYFVEASREIVAEAKTPFELTPTEPKRKARAEKEAAAQGELGIGGVELAGATPAARAMAFELTQKQKQTGGGEKIGGLFEKEQELALKPVEGKQPWEMTREEYGATIAPMTSKKGAGKIPTKETPMPEGGKIPDVVRKEIQKYTSAEEFYRAVINIRHHNELKQQIKLKEDEFHSYKYGEMHRKHPYQDEINWTADEKAMANQIRQDLKKLRDELNVMETAKSLPIEHLYKELPDDIFIRFNKPPKSKVSKNYQTGETLSGLSVIEGRVIERDGKYAIEPSGLTDTGTIEGYIIQRRPAMLYSGEVIGYGPDGEPLIANYKKLYDLRINDDGNFAIAGIDIKETLKKLYDDTKSLPKPSRPPREGGQLSHQEIVQQALSEGKPVPPEVLKDYPELAGKVAEGAVDYEKKNQALRTELERQLPLFGKDVSSARGAVPGAAPRPGEGAGARTRAIGITAELVKKGRVDLRGKTARTPEDIAVLAQVYRDPRIETLRLIYVKGDKIVAHEGITSRMPGIVKVFNEKAAQDIWQIRQRMRRLGADGYYLLHNHPSGNVEISGADATLTEAIAKKVPGLKAHVVIDSGKYSAITILENGRASTETIDLPALPKGWEDPLLTPTIPHKFLGRELSAQTVAEMGRELGNKEGYVTALYRSMTGKLRAIQEIPVNLFKNTKEATKFFKGRSRAFGAGDVVVYTENLTDPAINQAAVTLIKNGTLIDTISPAGGVAEKGIEAEPGWIMGAHEGEIKGYSVAEEKAGTKERREAPVFYSQLSRVVEAKLPGSGTAEQFRQMINSWAGKGEFKADELKWSGLDDYLKEKQGKVSKQEVVDFLKANQVEIKEITKGEPLKKGELPPGYEIKTYPNGKLALLEPDGTIVAADYSTREDLIADLPDILKTRGTPEPTGTKFSNWQLPSGENYKEMLLTLPSKADKAENEFIAYRTSLEPKYGPIDSTEAVNRLNPKDKTEFERLRDAANKAYDETPGYKSPHWDEPNVLAHVRMNDRTDAEGKRVLLLEEVQSDWHQEGRKKGYASEKSIEAQKRLAEIDKRLAEIKNLPAAEVGREEQALWNERATIHDQGSGIPPAPFAKTWHELVMKRMLRYAADKGYDKLAWTTGEQQAERYDLSKHLETIYYDKNKDGTFTITAKTLNGQNIDVVENAALDKISDYVGKDIAQRIQEGKGDDAGGGTRALRDLDLKVGGEGMKGFYDQIIPSFLNKYGKKWGARVGETEIFTSQQDEPIFTVHSIDITPAMKESVMQGQALFEKKAPWNATTFKVGGQDVVAKDLSTGKYLNDFRRKLDPEHPEDVDLAKEPDVAQTRNYLKNEAVAMGRTIADTFKNRPASSIFEKLLASPEFYKHPVHQRLVQIAVESNNRYHELLNDSNKVDDPGIPFETVTEAVEALSRKGVPWAEAKLGKQSREKAMLDKIVDEGDVEQKDPEAFEKELRMRNTPADVIQAWKLMRTGYDKHLEKMLGPLREEKARIDEEAAFSGKEPVYPKLLKMTDDQGKERVFSLPELIGEVEKYKGSYAPRIRVGDWVVTGRRGEAPAMYGTGEYYREHTRTRLQANRLKIKLEGRGWKDVEVSERAKIPESTYQIINVMETAKFLEKSVEGIAADPETKIKLLESVLEQAAEFIKERGYLKHTIHRQKGVVVRGYITDSADRFIRYLSNVSAGLAKAEKARALSAAFFGEYVNGKKEGGIDPMREPRAYEVGRKYIEEQLRNPDRSDRIIALAKSVASMKFLGLKPRSILVNLTSMVTSVPAALRQYGTDARADFTEIGAAETKAGRDFAKFMVGKYKPKDVAENVFLNELMQKNYDRPQYARDATGRLRDAYGRLWGQAVSGAMFAFGKSEQWMRGSTMLAAFRLAKKYGADSAEATQRAIQTSARAHGVYGKETLPWWAQGSNPAAKVGQMLYTYAKFPHTYVQTMRELGFSKHDIKGMMWMVMAPVVLGGVASLPFKDELVKVVRGVMRVLGDHRDPERMVWDGVRSYLGEGGEQIGRFGLFGAAGVDLSGSLSIGVGLPRNLTELTGPIGGALAEFRRGAGYFQTGQPLRAIETVLPGVIGDTLRAVRELKGVTTSTGRRVWDENGRPLIPTAGETGLRVAGFRSARQAALSARTREAKREAAGFEGRRTNIYEEYRALYLDPTPEGLTAFADKVQRFNAEIVEAGVQDTVPFITRQSLRTQARAMMRPSKKQRGYLGLQPQASMGLIKHPGLGLRKSSTGLLNYGI